MTSTAWTKSWVRSPLLALACGILLSVSTFGQEVQGTEEGVVEGGQVQPELAEAPSSEISEPTGIEVTFLPRELLSGRDWGDILGSTEATLGVSDPVELALCRGLAADLEDGQWHDVASGQVRLLEAWIAEELTVALGSEKDLLRDGALVVYLGCQAEPPPEISESSDDEEPVEPAVEEIEAGGLEAFGDAAPGAADREFQAPCPQNLPSDALPLFDRIGARSAALSTSGSGNPQIGAPAWQVGDFWVVASTERNRLAPRSVWMPMQEHLFVVVAEVEIDGESHYVIECWPYPVQDGFAGAHAAFYFRAADLALVRHADYYYASGTLQAPAQADETTVPGLPRVGPTKPWTPSFPLRTYPEPTAADGNPAALDGRGQLVSQELVVLPSARLWLAVADLAACPGGLVAVHEPIAYGMILTEGSMEDRSAGHAAASHQIWIPGLPWCLYEEHVDGSGVVRRAWVTQLGSFGSETQPADNIDRTSIRPPVETPPGERSSESYAASFEPWTGCWWPEYDSSSYANLYDTSGTWTPLLDYDSYFTPGSTPARTWEYQNHRTTDPNNSWWGHCHAWAAASLLETKPYTDRGTFNRGDQEGLLTESWYDYSNGYWRPTNGSAYDGTPMPPGALWDVVRYNIRDLHRPVGMDLCSVAPQVWNYPVYSYSVTYYSSGGNKYYGDITINYEQDYPTPPSQNNSHASRTLGFTNVAINSGVVDPASGTWTSSSDGQYPDIAWYPAQRIGGNPYVDYLNARGMIKINPPSNLSASWNGSVVTLTWTDNASNESGFKLERKTGASGSWSQVKTVGSNVTSTTDNPACGSTYYYRVRAYNSSDGNSLYSNEASVVPAGAAAPTSVSASDGSYCSYVRISWTASTGAASYQIWRATSATGTYSQIGTDTASPYDDSSASGGATYYYKLKAVNACGTSGYSSYDSGYRPSGTPAAPTGVTASDGAYSSYVRVSWNGVTGATSYQIWRSTSATGTYTQIATDTASPYDDSTATTCVTYYYKVKAVNVCGASAFSAYDSGYAGSIPAAPTGVAASDGTYCGYVRVSWTASTGATSYQMWRSTSATGTYSQIGTDTASPYDDSGATAGTTYYYKVKALNGCGTSGYSSYNSGYRPSGVPAAPTGVAASDGSYCGYVRVTWSTVTGATNYEVWRSTSATGTYSKIADDSASPYDDSSASGGATYYYKLKATNACGASGYSAYDSGFRPSAAPAAPTGVSASDNVYCGYVRITWNAVTGATGYEIWRSTSATGTYSLIGTDTASPYDDTSATAGTTYYYKMKATNSCGASAYSSYDSGKRKVCD